MWRTTALFCLTQISHQPVSFDDPWFQFYESERKILSTPLKVLILIILFQRCVIPWLFCLLRSLWWGTNSQSNLNPCLVNAVELAWAMLNPMGCWRGQGWLRGQVRPSGCNGSIRISLEQVSFDTCSQIWPRTEPGIWHVLLLPVAPPSWASSTHLISDLSFLLVQPSPCSTHCSGGLPSLAFAGRLQPASCTALKHFIVLLWQLSTSWLRILLTLFLVWILLKV